MCFATVWLPSNQDHHTALVQALRRRCRVRLADDERLTDYAIVLRLGKGSDVVVDETKLPILEA